jgi:uroporphyrinogen-III synthase
MKAIVTRPAAQAAEWVARLEEHGIEAAALPLIAVLPPGDPAAVVAAWRALGATSLVMFVSPNAVERFFAARPEEVSWPAATRAASVGPGTTQALRGCGLPREAIVAPRADATQFDSESLWAVLRDEDWRGRHALVVRGEGGRDWLADRLREAGATVDFVAAYRRAAPAFDAQALALLGDAGARPADHVWLLSSSEALDHLDAAATGLAWPAQQAIATHPRIAERAQRLGFGRVLMCRPEAEAVVACIKSAALRRRPS